MNKLPNKEFIVFTKSIWSEVYTPQARIFVKKYSGQGFLIKWLKENCPNRVKHIFEK